MRRQFYITEVFSENAYGGNQLATLPDAGDLDSREMQKIARAFNRKPRSSLGARSMKVMTSGFLPLPVKCRLRDIQHSVQATCFVMSLTQRSQPWLLSTWVSVQ